MSFLIFAPQFAYGGIFQRVLLARSVGIGTVSNVSRFHGHEHEVGAVAALISSFPLRRTSKFNRIDFVPAAPDPHAHFKEISSSLARRWSHTRDERSSSQIPNSSNITP